MSRTITAISGIEGSFSEEAALQRFGTSVSLEYLVTAEAVFAAVESGAATRGVVALSNTLGGAVEETVVAMGKHAFRMEDIFLLEVRQNLLVKPGTRRKEIKEIVSHPQGIEQCKAYLGREFPKVPARSYGDTALAAKDLAAGKLTDQTAVIASRRAAELFGLEILGEDIADQKPNTTSFLLLAQE